ncbi:MAG: hypothetical protein ACTJHU_00740 [Mycetocola sp.]
MSAPLYIQVDGVAGLGEYGRLLDRAAEAGVAGVVLGEWGAGAESDSGPHPTFDPSVLAGALGATGSPVPLIISARVDRHAPYNLARRLVSLNRIGPAPVGLFVEPGPLDPLTAQQDRADEAEHSTARAGEFAELVRTLWGSFPAEAIIGDQGAGEFADPALITHPRHHGRSYHVAGALPVPAPAGQQPLIAVGRRRQRLSIGDDRAPGVQTREDEDIVQGDSSYIIAQLATKAAEDGFDGFVLLVRNERGQLEALFDEILPQLRGISQEPVRREAPDRS